MRNAISVGVVAAILATVVLGGAFYALWQYEPNITNIVTWQVLAITAVSILVFGIVITALCSYISVNKFLKMTAGELYKI